MTLNSRIQKTDTEELNGDSKKRVETRIQKQLKRSWRLLKRKAI